MNTPHLMDPRYKSRLDRLHALRAQMAGLRQDMDAFMCDQIEAQTEYEALAAEETQLIRGNR